MLADAPAEIPLWSYSETQSIALDYYVGIGFSGTTPGDYSNNNFMEVISDVNQGWSLSGGFPAFTSFEVTEFGMPAEIIRGTFSGELIDPAGNSQNINRKFTLTIPRQNKEYFAF